MMSSCEIISRCGQEVLPYLDAAARLRIEVFRDFPYLYDGTADYESEYLQTYARCPDSIFVLALAAGEVVGVSTGLPLHAADDAFQAPFREVCLDTKNLFYHGESVLRHDYRGQGIGHAFFDHREDHARRIGCEAATFCSVVRPNNHPLRPPGYRSNEAFWRKRGYDPTELYATLAWQQIDFPQEQQNQLQFWIRRKSDQ